MQPPRVLPFASLLYRYWFCGWLFRDASRGNSLEREAALRHNVECARWLPTYMLRWGVLGVVMYSIGFRLEGQGSVVAAPVAFVGVCVAASVLAVFVASWWVLRGPRSAYLR